LLGAARDAHAEVVRLTLSDTTQRTSSLQAAGVAHQYLSKPCDAASLREAVGRSIALRLELADEKLIKAVTATRSLPSVPALYHRLSRELNTDDPSLERVAEIVAGDPAMTAKILQIVNSAFVGLRRRVSDARHAVTLLGIDMIMALVLVVEVFSQADERGPQASAVAKLWERAQAVAATAKEIIKVSGGTRSQADEAFLAGMLHDCGKLVLASNWPREFAEVEAAGGQGLREVIAFGADHGSIGAHLMAVWGLPDTVVEAVAFHHNPGASGARVLSPLSAVHDAVALEGRTGDDEDLELDRTYLVEAGLNDQLDVRLQVADDVACARELV
jgi:HD-like signal output (HDOD) protein